MVVGMQEEKGGGEMKKNATLFVLKKIKLLAVILFYTMAEFPLTSRQWASKPSA